MVKYSGSASSEATVLLIIYWVSMSELLLIVLTCEPTLLVVKPHTVSCMAEPFKLISMGLMFTPFQMLCFVQLFVFQQI